MQTIVYMVKHLRPYGLGQRLFVVRELRDWLPKEHLAPFVSDVVEELDF